MSKLINNFELIPLSDADTPLQIAWDNLKLADSVQNLEWIIPSAIGWLKASLGKNLYDLELAMRAGNLNTYLMALSGAEKKNINDSQLWLPGEEYNKVYENECSFCCKNRDTSYATIESHGGYGNNLNKLKNCGILVVADEVAVLQVSGSRVFVTNNKPDYFAICNNQKKLKLNQLTQTEFIKKLASQLNQQYNGAIKPMVYGTTNDNYPIIAFCIDGAIKSNIGYIFKSADNLEIYPIPQEDIALTNKNN